MADRDIPDVPVNFVPASAGEIIDLGAIKVRVMEDGSRTDNRIGAAEIVVPAGTPGPPPHWHEMHDETFLVTGGTLRFHVPGQGDIDAATGDYIVVPTRSPHTFSNPFEVEAKFFNTYTPAFYINYFKLLSILVKEGGGKMTPEVNERAMRGYATITLPKK
ncbi:RmlC-like cupin domain-containing protein [Lineolata rhizophorae]|uniref:RmlC-like cupin domain-containing protein n=1 Tax=Lineolata rhizophorae TaxID=578093 RepID=A0A6A6NWJ8_9PEZI|nr:RmlC-like cupin domain-containing protein [Lineolata rhizophorae]